MHARAGENRDGCIVPYIYICIYSRVGETVTDADFNIYVLNAEGKHYLSCQ